MRLFVALTPPDEVLAELERVTRRLTGLPDVDDNYRWSLPSQWHITLAFLGEVDDEVVPGLRRRLARAAARHQPLSLGLEGGGGFGSARRARVLWAGVTGDVGPLRAVARSVAAAARRAGLDVDEGSRFRAHVTLARLREPTDVRVAIEALDTAIGPRWEANEIELIRSRLGQGEGRRSTYDTIAAWPLGGHHRPDG